MPRKGREFEKFVANLEWVLGREGVKIQSPEYITGKSGVRNEIDVSLRGQLQGDTIDYLIVVQCQDRIKKGKVEWIRELIGLKDDIEAIRVIAVTSKGFTKESVKLAKKNGIILRTLQEMSQEEILRIYNKETIRLKLSLFNINSFSMKMLTEKEVIFYVLPMITSGEKQIVDISAPMLERKNDGSMLSLLDLFNSKTGMELYENLAENGLKKSFIICLKSQDLLEYRMKTSAGYLDFKFIDFTGEVWIEESEIPLKSIYQYKKHDESINENNVIIETKIFESKNEKMTFRVTDYNKTSKYICINYNADE